MMNIQSAIESANNFGALRKIADRVHPNLSFFGADYISSSHYEGTATIDALLRRVGVLVHKIPYHNRQNIQRPLLEGLSRTEKSNARTLSYRIESLFDEEAFLPTSSRFYFLPAIFRNIRNVSEMFYNFVRTNFGQPQTNPRHEWRTCCCYHLTGDYGLPLNRFR